MGKENSPTLSKLVESLDNKSDLSAVVVHVSTTTLRPLSVGFEHDTNIESTIRANKDVFIFDKFRK
jgi:hypothetical protein